MVAPSFVMITSPLAWHTCSEQGYSSGFENSFDANPAWSGTIA
jgi:hypothetical protein